MSRNKPISLTDEQLAAINANGDLLVVASAGTGKTSTLISRCERFIFDEVNPIPLDRILMVTFTEAAAAEMRLRIRKKLEDALFKSKYNENVVKQLALLTVANISTLHSFCLQLIRTYFYLLELDPQIYVFDEGQARILALKTLDVIFRQHYEGNDEYSQRVKQLIIDRARGYDPFVKDDVLRLYYFAQSLPKAQLWLKSQYDIYNNPQPVKWEEALNSEFADWVNHWKGKLPRWQNIENVANCISELEKILPNTPLNQAFKHLQQIKNYLDADWKPGTAKIKNNFLGEFVRDVDFFVSLQPIKNPDGTIENPILNDWELTRHQIKTLIELAIEFDTKFSAAKRESGGVDFNDLEQMTIKLLVDDNDKPTLVAEELRSRFDLIFVDEYQDINSAQHTIISSICRTGNQSNRFIVGDVKQSIYRFRRANPYIFQKLRTDWSNNQEHKSVVQLSKNFRSDKKILSFVNELFSKLMRLETGRVGYNKDAFLVSGLEDSNDDSDSRNRVELHLFLKGGENEEDAIDDKNGDESEPTAIQKEAAMIAERLKSLKESKFKIKDKESGEMRELEWRDMVVLLRSPATRSEIYVREFNDRNVPLIMPCGNVFNAIEVQDIINLLRLIDNPLQDLPLAAVLRSPLVGFTNKELTLIRVAAKGGRLWTALNIFINSTQNIKNKIGESISIDTEEYQEILEILDSARRKGIGFIELFNKWRGLSRQVSLSHCIETILDDTQYCIWCQAQVGGAQKHSNIQLLLGITRQFDPLQRQGLARFLRYIDANKEAEIEIEPASVEGENAVRMMSIHQSKGLEFPVVCIADTAKKFNLMDVYSDIILDDSLGICPKVHLSSFAQIYPSPIHWVARRRNLQESIGEEIRLLYVAMTRARDMLIISGSASLSMIEKLKDVSTAGDISPNAILKSQNYLQWICLWLWSHYNDDKWYDSGGGIVSSLVWRINKFDYSAASAQKQSAEKYNDETATEDSDKLEELEKRFSWVYPFINATKEPAKTSVSEIRRRIVDEDDSVKIFTPPIRRIIVKPTSGQKKLPAVVRGEAYHKFLELIDFNKCATIDGVVNELNRLVAEGSISLDYAAAIVPEKIFNFWSSETGKMLLSNAKNLHRELPFTIRMNPKESGLKIMLSDGTEDEFVVVQGVIDLCMISENEIWLLDYKTDEMKPDEIEIKNKEYIPQIELYSYALRIIYNRPVTKKWLHYFSIDKTIGI